LLDAVFAFVAAGVVLSLLGEAFFFFVALAGPGAVLLALLLVAEAFVFLSLEGFGVGSSNFFS
jgi:hypothetical protein